VICLQKRNKLVILLDGWELRPEKGKSAERIKQETVLNWWGMANALLKMVGEIGADETAMPMEDGQKLDTPATESSKWTIVSATDLPKPLKKILIPQNDTYSCGPIAIMNLICNCGEIDPEVVRVAEKGNNVAMALKRMGIVEKLTNWVKECCERQGLSEHFAKLFEDSESQPPSVQNGQPTEDTETRTNDQLTRDTQSAKKSSTENDPQASLKPVNDTLTQASQGHSNQETKDTETTEDNRTDTIPQAPADPNSTEPMDDTVKQRSQDPNSRDPSAKSQQDNTADTQKKSDGVAVADLTNMSKCIGSWYRDEPQYKSLVANLIT
jgi:hypothetical protein